MIRFLWSSYPLALGVPTATIRMKKSMFAIRPRESNYTISVEFVSFCAGCPHRYHRNKEVDVCNTTTRVKDTISMECASFGAGCFRHYHIEFMEIIEMPNLFQSSEMIEKLKLLKSISISISIYWNIQLPLIGFASLPTPRPLPMIMPMPVPMFVSMPHAHASANAPCPMHLPMPMIALASRRSVASLVTLL